MRIRVPNYYRGLPSDFKPIYPGDYDSDDERLYGLADYLVQTGHAEALDAPLPFRKAMAVETVEEKSAVEIDAMTVNELHAFAAEHAIELGGARRRDDILQVLHTWLDTQALPSSEDGDD